VVSAAVVAAHPMAADFHVPAGNFVVE